MLVLRSCLHWSCHDYFCKQNEISYFTGSLYADGYSRIIAVDNMQSTKFSRTSSGGELKALEKCAICLPELNENAQLYDLVKVSGLVYLLSFFEM